MNFFRLLFGDGQFDLRFLSVACISILKASQTIFAGKATTCRSTSHPTGLALGPFTCPTNRAAFKLKIYRPRALFPLLTNIRITVEKMRATHPALPKKRLRRLPSSMD